MCSASGWLVRGKKQKNQINVRKITETTLIHMPCLPKLHRAAGKGSFRMRLMIRQTNEIMYEVRREATPKEAIALKAAVEPMLIKDRRIVTTNETMTAFTGTFQPGFTCSKPVSQSRSAGEARANNQKKEENKKAYMRQESRIRHSSISCKSKELAGGRGNIADGATNGQDDENRCHGRSATGAIGYIVEDLNEWISSLSLQNPTYIVPQTETVGNEHGEAESTVQE